MTDLATLANDDDQCWRALDALHDVWDPELGFDVVALGFVYDIRTGHDLIHLDMTLTTPAVPSPNRFCPKPKQRSVVRCLWLTSRCFQVKSSTVAAPMVSSSVSIRRHGPHGALGPSASRRRGRVASLRPHGEPGSEVTQTPVGRSSRWWGRRSAVPRSQFRARSDNIHPPQRCARSWRCRRRTGIVRSVAEHLSANRRVIVEPKRGRRQVCRRRHHARDHSNDDDDVMWRATPPTRRCDLLFAESTMWIQTLPVSSPRSSDPRSIAQPRR